MAGQLIEPPGLPDPHRPLVVLVHGSEQTAAIGSQLPFVLAAQGLSVFVYDKRGTGGSEGYYTQNFELLADDAAAALTAGRKLAAGRVDRAGFFGGSQGGWIAPLAANRSSADFVAIAYGLVASPIEEDRAQMELEVRALGLGDNEVALTDRLSKASTGIILSGFKEGYDELATVKREMADKPWAAKIEGEWSGAFLRMPERELRRIGRARFDNVELIWNYDAMPPLRDLKVPLLWVLAGEDREAPIGETKSALTRLIKEGKDVDLYVFPNTDHGMLEFTTAPDGSRTATRVTDGYYRLVGDWIKGKVSGLYGQAQQVK